MCMTSKYLVTLGLYLIGYGILAWSEGWVIALAIFFIQWASNLQWRFTYDQK
jgi:hypothetical protein